MRSQMFAGGRLESVRCRRLSLALCAGQPDRQYCENNSAEEDRSPRANCISEVIPHAIYTTNCGAEMAIAPSVGSFRQFCFGMREVVRALLAGGFGKVWSILSVDHGAE